MRLRRLNEEGIRRFGEYLDSLRTPTPLPYPNALLTDNATSEGVGSTVEVVPRSFDSRFQAAEYLQERLAESGLLELHRDRGFWTWLALFYHDTLCPMDGRGQRTPGARARHILESTNYQRYYRHLLAGPLLIYRAHRDDPTRALAVLWQPVDTPGDIVEQLASRQELISNRAIMSAATELYIDRTTRAAKRGAGGKSRGSARRLASLCNQLDVTWDLYAMNTPALLDKLPREFERFRKT